jgi:hypothetical protein
MFVAKKALQKSQGRLFSEMTPPKYSPSVTESLRIKRFYKEVSVVPHPDFKKDEK